jgi:WD40 repeat protein
VTVVTLDSKSAAQPLIIQDGRVIAGQRQDVPSERDGKLLFLATPARTGEFVPRSKLLEYEVPMLAVRVDTADAWRALPEEERLRDVDSPTKYFRAVRGSDSLAPGTTVVIRQKMRFRKLDVGDRVKEGQLLGVINPSLAMEELFIKQAGVEVADREINQSYALYEEYKRRSAQMLKLRNKGQGYVTDDDYGATLATATKYKEEGKAKEAALGKAQRELAQALTTLKLYMIRASIDGVIKTVYKHHGEAVKSLEPVLQIQNPHDLRVEAQIEVQDALALRDRMNRARRLRDEARDLAARSEELQERNPTQSRQYLDAAKRKVADARELLAVWVEASRVEPPRAILSGHLQEVTCVAVSGGSRPRIISGSEDHTVRIWAQGEDRWAERARLDHHAVVRAVACTGPVAQRNQRNLLLTATATGRGRLFDLDKIGDKNATQIDLEERHSGAINAVAFSEDGGICATGGEDRSIRLWETAEGKLLGRVSGAHQSGVTSLAFTAKGKLVSVGRDRRLVVWDVVDGGDGKKLVQAMSFDRRSNEVPVLGVDAEGSRVTFDEGREVRVMSLESRKIEGRLANPPGSPSFSTLALFSPDGTSILTNGNAPGRLQLWRAPSAKNRASELRNFAWSNGKVTSGAFDPDGAFAVTGTSDGRVLTWAMPSKEEAEQGPLSAQLNYVEEFLDTSLKRVAVKATLDQAPEWIIPGGSATIVVPPLRPTK